MKTRFHILSPALLGSALLLTAHLMLPSDASLALRGITLAGAVAVVVLGLFFFWRMRRDLVRTERILDDLNRGRIPGVASEHDSGDFAGMRNKLATHLDTLRSRSRFARSLASGDFTGKYEQAGPDDELGAALLSLKESLMRSTEESEKRRLEEENRSWAAQGLAEFSKLFREAEDDLGNLARVVTRALVGYTEADVAVLYVLEESEGGEGEQFRLYGSYAFDREKHVDSVFMHGEGLVGRAAVEKEMIYLTDLPPDYIKIRSGLGEDMPSSVLIAPVMLDGKVLAVIEMASLGIIPPLQMDFIRQMSDALAATLSKVKAYLQNRELYEQTKKQADALASQESIFKARLEELERSNRQSP